MNFNEPDDVPEDLLNRILWGDAKGWDTPYPKLRYGSHPNLGTGYEIPKLISGFRSLSPN